MTTNSSCDSSPYASSRHSFSARRRAAGEAIVSAFEPFTDTAVALEFSDLVGAGVGGGAWVSHTPCADSSGSPASQPRDLQIPKKFSAAVLHDKEALLEEIFNLKNVLNARTLKVFSEKWQSSTTRTTNNKKLEKHTEEIGLERFETPKTGRPGKLLTRMHGLKSRVKELRHVCEEQRAEICLLRKEFQLTHNRETEVERDVFAAEVIRLLMCLSRLESWQRQLHNENRELLVLKDKTMLRDIANKRLESCLAAMERSAEKARKESDLYRKRAFHLSSVSVPGEQSYRTLEAQTLELAAQIEVVAADKERWLRKTRKLEVAIRKILKELRKSEAENMQNAALPPFPSQQIRKKDASVSASPKPKVETPRLKADTVSREDALRKAKEDKEKRRKEAKSLKDKQKEELIKEEKNKKEEERRKKAVEREKNEEVRRKKEEERQKKEEERRAAEVRDEAERKKFAEEEKRRLETKAKEDRERLAQEARKTTERAVDNARKKAPEATRQREMKENAAKEAEKNSRKAEKDERELDDAGKKAEQATRTFLQQKTTVEEGEEKQAEEKRRKETAKEELRREAGEEVRRKEAEEEEMRRKMAEDEAKRKEVEADDRGRKVAEETLRRETADVEARRKAAEEEEQKRKMAEEARRKAAEGEERRRKTAEGERRMQMAAEEARRKAVEESRRKIAEEKLRIEAAENGARRNAAEEEEGRRKKEELKREEEQERKLLTEKKARKGTEEVAAQSAKNIEKEKGTRSEREQDEHRKQYQAVELKDIQGKRMLNVERPEEEGEQLTKFESSEQRQLVEEEQKNSQLPEMDAENLKTEFSRIVPAAGGRSSSFVARRAAKAKGREYAEDTKQVVEKEMAAFADLKAQRASIGFLDPSIVDSVVLQGTPRRRIDPSPDFA